MEVYLSNHTGQRVEWGKVLLNGEEVRGMTNNVVWSQYYPLETAESGPGRAILLQINLATPPSNVQRVEVQTRDGRNVQVEFQPLNDPRATITGATFSMDFRKMYVTYRLNDQDDGHDRSVQQVLVQGKELISVSQIFDEKQETNPGRQGLIVVNLPTPVSQGDMLHVRLQFATGVVVQNLFRAWNRIFIHDFGVPEKNAKLRQELGLDLELPVRPIPLDPSCNDLHAGCDGHSARAILEMRRKWYVEGDKRLSFPPLCTSTSGSTHYSIYGQCADALELNPYCLGWHTTPRFPDIEEKRLQMGVEASRPRPCYWIPETFCYGERMLEADELRCLMYAILGVGVKGIHYFIHGGLPGLKGYGKSPPLLAGVKKIGSSSFRVGENA